MVAALIGRAHAQRLGEEWRMRREAERSSDDPIQEVEGTHKRQPT